MINNKHQSLKSVFSRQPHTAIEQLLPTSGIVLTAGAPAAGTPPVRLASLRSMSGPPSRAVHLVLRLIRQGSGPTSPRKHVPGQQETSGIAPIAHPRAYASQNQTKPELRTSARSSRSYTSTPPETPGPAQTSRAPKPRQKLTHPETPAGVGEHCP